jgi:PAS domain S-box-containing protein
MTQIHEELLSIVSDLIGLIHPDGRIELSSEVWRGRLCPQAAECQSMKVSDLIHVDDVGEFNRSIQRALAGELVEPFETRIRNREGHSLWICWRIQKSSVHHGAVFSGKDVSAEKTSRTQLQQIGEVSCIGGWEIDLEQMKLHWSPETYAIHEVDPQTFEPKLEEGVSFYIDESKNIISEAVKAMFETGKCFDLQLRFRTAKGSLRWVRSVSRVEFRAGRVVRCYGSIQDITEQVEKDSRTRAMNERFEAIVNNIPLMVSYFNPQGQFEWINPGWTSELGWDLESMKNVDMMEEFYPDPTYRKEVIEFMMSGATDWRDFLTRKRDGSFINTSWANVRLSNGYSIGIGRNIEESKRLNDDLRDAYDRLTLAMSVGGLGTWELYPKTGQVKFSDQWCKMMGLNPKDVVQDASTWKSLAHPVDAEIGYAGTYRCLNGEIPVYQGIQRLRHANGSWVWVQTSGQVVKRDESGAPEKFLAITLDVTHIKDSEEQLVEHNQVLEVMKQRLELAVRAGRFGVWDWNMKSGDLVWDAMMYDLFEIDPLHFSNDFDAFQKCLHPEDTGRVRDQLDFTFRTRASEFRSEFRVITKTGAIKTIAALASCFYDSDGNIDRLVGNNWDVTEQRNAEAALAEARVEAERFFTMSLDLLAVAGIDGYLKRVNPSFTKVLGFTEEELLAKPYAEFVHPDDYAATLLEAERLARGIPTRHFENRYRTKEGKYRTFSWVSTADLETKTIYCAVRDLTDQRESEVRLLQSAKMASLGEMAGGNRSRSK